MIQVIIELFKLLVELKPLLSGLLAKRSQQGPFSACTLAGEISGQDRAGVSRTWRLKLEMTQKRGVLAGTGAVGDLGDEDEIVVGGLLVQGRTAIMHYTATDPMKMLAGSMTLQLDAAGEKFIGRYTGLGPVTSTVIAGDVVLKVMEISR